MGLAGVCLELGEGPVELRSPMVVEVPVVGQTCVGREPGWTDMPSGLQGTGTSLGSTLPTACLALKPGSPAGADVPGTQLRAGPWLSECSLAPGRAFCMAAVTC